jgi:hypothetical protein
MHSPMSKGGTTEVDKACYGCLRSFLNGKSFMNPSEEIAWVTGGRGNWCLDCFSLWRTVYSGEQTLQNFHLWLQSRSNKDSFDFSLVASLTLSLEEHGRITSAMVSDRMKVLAFAFRVLGLPVGPCVVLPIDEVATGPGSSPDPASLITIRSKDGGDRLGMLVSEVLTKGRGVLVRRPEVLGLAPFLSSRSSVACSSEADRQALAKVFDTEQVAVAGTSLAVKDEFGQITPTKANRFEAKLAAITTQPKQVVDKFTTEAWENIKESTITGFLQKIHALHDEVSILGQKDIIVKCEEWIFGLSAVKSFLKSHRDWRKSNSKLPKFMEMLEPLVKFDTFMRETMQVAPSSTIALMLHKLRFFDEVFA